MAQITEIEPNVDLIEQDGRRFYLVGTAHVSSNSADLVERILREHKPDTVCLELCPARHEALSSPDRWKETDIFSVIRTGRAYVLMVQFALSAFQKKLADELRIRPGEEMLRAMAVADELEIEVSLVDREVRTTFKRAWSQAGIWSILKIAASLFSSLFSEQKITKENIEELKKADELTMMMDEFSGFLPGVKEALIDERDQYLAHKILKSPGDTVVAVVGAGHVPGIREVFGTDIDIEALEQLPPRKKSVRIIAWGVPLAVTALVVTGFVFSGRETGEQMVIAWVLANGIAASIGTMIALAHPITIITAFVAAPLTSLNPTIAAGWVCGLTEAWIRKPRVLDLQNVASDITSVRGIWGNRVSRVLLVVILANLGSSIGTFVGVGWAISLLGS